MKLALWNLQSCGQGRGVKERIKVIRVVVGLNQGGVQQMILNLFKGLNRDIFEPVALAIENTGAIGSEIEKAGFRVINLGMHRSSFSFLSIIKALYKTFREENPHIVHGSSYYPSVYARVAARLAEVPVLISHEHTVFQKTRPKRQMIGHLISKFTDKHIAVSEEVKRHSIKYYRIIPEKIEVIYNGVDTEYFAPELSKEDAKKNLNIEPDSFVIGYVGRLDPEKGHRYLFEALRLLKEKFPLKAVMVGTGRGEKEVRNQAEKSEVDGIVNFLGLQRNIPEILSAFDVFVLPSIQEGFSNALVEAMAMGCPAVATDISGNKEAIVDGIEGFLVPPGKPDAIASAVERLLSDKGLGIRMSMSARKRVEEHFSLKRHVEQMENLYITLLKEKGILS